jgi:transposase
MFSYMSPAQRVPKDHPLRAIRTMVDEVLRRLWSDFEKLYSHTGRPSIAPERLLRALLLQVLYSIRSERMLMEQLDYNLLFRWFVGLSMDDEIWDPTVFTKNRDRLLRGQIAVLFFEQVLAEARERGLTSDEHFTVDGTLVEAWAGLKSFKRKDGSDDQTPPDDPGNPTVNFHGEKRSNETHQSTTDPDARLATKGSGQEAKLFFMGHVVMENRNGLAVGARLTMLREGRSGKRRLSFWVRSHAGAGSLSVRTRATTWPDLWASCGSMKSRRTWPRRSATAPLMAARPGTSRTR